MPSGIYKKTEKHRRRISKALIGHPMYKLKTRSENISKSIMGNTNKKGSKLSKEARKRISMATRGVKKPLLSLRMKGRKQSKSLIKKRTRKLIGQKRNKETKDKMSVAQRKRFENHVYKTDESKIWRSRIEYRLWREAVFARDNWTCQKCIVRGNKALHPHHIRNFAEKKQLRFAIDNGITLCIGCHKGFHGLYGVKNNNIVQIEEFIERGKK